MLSFDEINRLARQKEPRSMDIDKFFDEMEIPAEEKEERKEFARLLEDRLLAALAFIFAVLQTNIPNGVETAKTMVEEAVISTIRMYTVPDSALILYAQDYSDEFVDATIRNQGNAADPDSVIDNQTGSSIQNVGGGSKKPAPITGAYFFSQDRARLNAENEANTVFNYNALRDAKARGMKYKKWNTMADERVRLTHAEVDGVIVPIDGTFDVGGYEMQYPHEIGAPAKEVVNCRCWLTFQKKL